MSSDPINISIIFILIFVLLFLNGVVILGNTALESVNRSVVKKLAENEGDNSKSLKYLYELLEKPSKYRYTCRLLSCIFLIGAMVLLVNLPYNKAICTGIFVVAVYSFSDIFPRKIAIQHGEALALKMAGTFRILCKIFSPLVFLLLQLSNALLRIFRQDTEVDDKEYSEDDVMSMLEEGQERGALKEEGKKMINSIFEFDDELAYEIMTPRTDVFYIDMTDSPSEYVDQLMELRYSRIPVCENGTDNIVGILHIKDYLIKAREDGFDKVDIKGILRQPYLVPETKKIDSLFFELQKEKQHIAILIDEYGGFSGIVTMEDIIEEVMGDIDDEYDIDDEIIEKIDDNSYFVDGNVALDDLNEELGINLESDNSETIGGFIIDILGEIPKEGDFARLVEFENYIFNILSVKERRIEKIKLSILPKENKEEESKKSE